MTACPSGKTRYRSAQRAARVLSRIWSSPKPGRRLERRAYHCPDCFGWHLTSKPQRPEREDS